MLRGFDRHKGYGTADHLQALEDYGPCPIHRAGYGPVRDALERRKGRGGNKQTSIFLRSSRRSLGQAGKLQA